MKTNDFWIGLGTAGVGTGALLQALGFASVPGMRFGAWTFPAVASAGLLICGVLLVIAAVRAPGRAATEPPFDQPEGYAVPPREAVISLVFVTLAPVIYLTVADAAGFVITCAAILFGLSLWFWRGVLRCAVLGAIGAVVLELIFSRLFAVPLPRGVFSVAGLL